MSPEDVQTPAALSAARALCHEPPSQEIWERLTQVIDAAPAAARAVAVEYACAHVDASWPDHLRAPPEAWRAQMLSGTAPVGWPLVCAHHVVLEALGDSASARMLTIRALCDLFAWPFERAVEAVDACPSRVCAWVSAARAEEVWRELHVVGAHARVERAWTPRVPSTPGCFDVQLRRIARSGLRVTFTLCRVFDATPAQAKAHIEGLRSGAVRVQVGWDRARVDAAVDALGQVGVLAWCMPASSS